jgi:hypothetical protein
MGVITDLDARVRELANMASGIKQVVYDDLHRINADSKNNYPLLLFRVTDSETPDIRKKTQYPQILVDFYLSDTHFQGDTATLPEKQDSLDEMLLALVNTIPDSHNSNRQNDFELLSSSSAEFAWNQHNDNVMIVKRTVTIRGFQCVTKLE